MESYIQRTKKDYHLKSDSEFIVGYEAGCTGLTLYRELEKKNIKCIVMAPSTISSAPGQRKRKTDKLDAAEIARALGSGYYHSVYVSSREDESVKKLLSARDYLVDNAKRAKQVLLSFLLHLGHKYDGKTWTEKHWKWIGSICLENKMNQKTFEELKQNVIDSINKVNDMDKRVIETAESDEYRDRVNRLRCFRGIDYLVSLSLITIIGDFTRFKEAKNLSSYLGLVPGECSSGESRHITPITKEGNGYLRRIIMEAANSLVNNPHCNLYSRRILSKQYGQDVEVVSLANKANYKIHQKILSMLFKGKDHNTIKGAVARMLICYVWAMMTGKEKETRPDKNMEIKLNK